MELRGKVLSALCKALGLTTGSTKKKRKLTIKSLYSLSSKLAFLLKNKGGGELNQAFSHKCSLEEMGPVVADLEKFPRFLPLETL